jgi:hypothetical protein
MIVGRKARNSMKANKPKKERKPNPAHILFEKHLAELGLQWTSEVAFHPTRKWRWDYVFLAQGRKYGVELQGGFYRGIGGHNSITGIQRDIDKQNAGVACGYWPLKFSTADVLKGASKSFIKEHLL